MTSLGRKERTGDVMRSLYVDAELKCKWCESSIIHVREITVDSQMVSGKTIVSLCPNCDGTVNYGADQRPEGS